MNSIEFANPEYFYLLLLILPMFLWYIFKDKNSQASIQISSFKGFENTSKTYRYYLRHSLFILRILAIVCLIIVIARPQSTNSWKTETSQGIDIVMALDVSSSMLAEDFMPNRLEAAKDVAAKFINGRPNDKIGLVIFSGESFTQCPLTTNQAVLLNLFKDIKSGMIEDGTAIGLGLANAVNRIKDSKAISKIIILLTDGVNNQGEIAPITAAELAKTFGIRVYTIGVGSQGTARYPVLDMFGNTHYQQMPVKIDEKVLRKISNLTDGEYFRATDNTSLKEVYEKIDKLEKSKIEEKSFSTKSEKYLWFAIFACIFLVLEILLRNTILRNIP